jgi:hypothetical protein
MRHLSSEAIAFSRFFVNGVLVRAWPWEAANTTKSTCSGVSSVYTDEKDNECVAYGRLEYLLRYKPFAHSEPMLLLRAKWFESNGLYGGLPRVREAAASSFLNRSIFALGSDVHPARIMFAPVTNSVGDYVVIVI